MSASEENPASGEFRLVTAGAEYSRELPASEALALEVLITALRQVDGAPSLSLRFSPDSVNGVPDDSTLLHVGVGRSTDFSIRLPKAIGSEDREVAKDRANELRDHVLSRRTVHITAGGELTI